MSRIKQFRKYLRYTQAEMAKKLGIPQNTYSNYESGIRKCPGEILEKLGLMGLNLNWLATGIGEMLSEGSEEPPGKSAAERVTPGFPEREIIKATELVIEFVGSGALSPVKMGHFVATIAELLVRGNSVETIRERVAPAVNSLAEIESKLPRG